jgi:hypothetical protein
MFGTSLPKKKIMFHISMSRKEKHLIFLSNLDGWLRVVPLLTRQVFHRQEEYAVSVSFVVIS